MQFLPENIYHIYNRGNNQQTLFFNRDNYLFFLKKMRKEILPHGDLLAYCLMPNHFHWMVYIRATAPSGGTDKHSLTTDASALNSGIGKHPLSNAIRTLLSSYTQAINKQENRTGHLFQQNTKAKCLTETRATADSGGTGEYGVEYALLCFNYIHQNPLRAGWVSKMEDWEFSSFADYTGKRNGSLCNRKSASQLLDLPDDKEKFYRFSYQTVDKEKIKKVFV